MTVKIINKSDNNLPAYETSSSAGMDLRAYLPEGPITLKPMHTGGCAHRASILWKKCMCLTALLLRITVLWAVTISIILEFAPHFTIDIKF